jgi:hypothetical protein
LPANSPFASPHVFDEYPGHLTHILAFNGNHGVSQSFDDFGLLLVREDILDEFDLNQWHALLLGREFRDFGLCSISAPARPAGRNLSQASEAVMMVK